MLKLGCNYIPVPFLALSHFCHKDWADCVKLLEHACLCEKNSCLEDFLVLL